VLPKHGGKGTQQAQALARENEFLVETLNDRRQIDPSDVSQSPAPSLVAKGVEFSVASRPDIRVYPSAFIVG
jgi:hypothetical protein